MRLRRLRTWQRERPFLATLGGLGLGVIGAGALILAIHYVIQPLMSREIWDTVTYRSASFNIWYDKHSPHQASHDDLRATMEEASTGVAALLGIEPSRIPAPIDVFVHETVEQLQRSIMLRKSPQATARFPASFDLLVGEDPRPRLVELVLAFAWGNCHSQILYAGTVLNAAYPQRNFHTVVAAAPVRFRHTLLELLRLEETHRIPNTIYASFTSPFSPRLLGSLEDLRRFYEMSATQEAAGEDFVSLETASLVRYLIDSAGGWKALQAVWGPGTTEALLARMSPRSLAELGTNWHAAAVREGAASEDYPRLRAAYLFESGSFDAAYEETLRWTEASLDDDARALRVRCALAVGAFDEAVSEVSRVLDEEARAPLTDLVNLFREWRVVEDGSVRVLGAGTTEPLSNVASSLRTDYETLAAELEIPPESLPPRLTLFLYSHPSARQLGRSLTPTETRQQTFLHAVPEDDLLFELAEVLPAYGWGHDTYSRLLRTGLAVALARTRDTLVRQGCELLDQLAWRPLHRIDFGLAPLPVVETEIGLLVRHLLDTRGVDVVRDVWLATSPLLSRISMDTALQTLVGISRDEAEGELRSSVLLCNREGNTH